MARSKLNNNQVQFDQSAGATGYLKIGGVLMQWGETSTTSTGTYQTWPIAFGGTPKVMVNLNDPGSQDPRCYNISSTGATMRQNYSASNLGVQWFAIGPA